MNNQMTTIKARGLALWLLLSALTLANPVGADTNHRANDQCPRNVIANADIVLTQEFPNARFNDNGTPLIGDDFVEVCRNGNFTNCDIVVDPIPTGVPGLTIIGGNGRNIIYGTPGDDIICGKAGRDLIDGGEGDDIIYGNNGNDDLSGGLGDDQLFGGNGVDILSGFDEDHDDVPDGDLNGDGFVDDLDSDQDLLKGGNGMDFLSGGPDNDSLFGENGKDVLWGGFGDDILSGGNGPDVLRGGPGNDDISGGNGKDFCRDPDNGGPNDDCRAADDDDDDDDDDDKPSR